MDVLCGTAPPSARMHTHTYTHTKSNMLSFPLHQCQSFRRRAHFTHHVTTVRNWRNKLHVFGMWNTFLVVSVASFLPITNWQDYTIQWKVFMYLHPPHPRVDFRATCQELKSKPIVNHMVTLASSVEIRLQGHSSEKAVKAYFFRCYFRESEL